MKKQASQKASKPLKGYFTACTMSSIYGKRMLELMNDGTVMMIDKIIEERPPSWDIIDSLPEAHKDDM